MNEYKNRMDTMYGQDQRPWGSEPLPVLTDFITGLKTGTVIDLGVGDGRNALYLAENGFDVTGVDLSETAIEKFTAYAKEAGLEDKVVGITKDITQFVFDKEYDNIICNFTLHFLLPDDFASLFEKIKRATVLNGINIISDFTQTGPMYPVDSKTRWLIDGELKELYKDWEILHFKEEERTARQKDSSGNNYIQMGTEIVAKKLANSW